MTKVILNIKNAGERRGVMNPFALARESGLNYAICYRLWHEQTTQISLPTLARICDTLSCEPGDLIVRGGTTRASARKGKRRSVA